ncbi:uncharacterized protein SPPG_05005 [Spizellomyces punctatus DAOM BR117]|uniref:2',3'-cyclic-nucleotide 3'-phosphodiesterase n=1 Tax=Spizellomyces punctatus (strain DAOM BR117) TaxID=645134 RepID=A0A0L0HFE1_SPIPD|nr:uncharacterized protein SPPG_05005 [Spizellomyces punctatus DAOM BR117]KNC99619.1 hypothetical protein SPPG_05005 [Spizellomyces punctatus DAOM BR117]|eukprot:XP_016607659.1 hypothetical protein SPPG_05005 [Spizellomyces punctatus DAOM BR117]
MVDVVYSLWLCPSEPTVQSYLKKVIDTFSDRLDTPKWNPHITLLGGINTSKEDVIALTRKVADAGANFNVTLSDIATKDLYYQCVMAVPHPSDPLIELNTTARKVFEKEDQPLFWPHLSLIYGDLDKELKREIAEEVKKEFNVVGQIVDVKSIQIWSTTGSPEKWEFIAETPLK